MRKIAREIAFMLIYEEQFNKERDVEFSFNFLTNEEEILGENTLGEEAKQFIRDIVSLYATNKDEIAELVNKNLHGFEPDRIYKIDKALMLAAVTEIYYYKTSAAVVVNEIVELAKKYSTDKSAGFINGILGSILKQNISE